jgi:hypothetical protein
LSESSEYQFFLRPLPSPVAPVIPTDEQCASSNNGTGYQKDLDEKTSDAVSILAEQNPSYG